MKNLSNFLNDKCKFSVTRNTRKIQSPFQIKDIIKYYSCVIHKGICFCKQSYTDEIVQNKQMTRLPRCYRNSKPANHLKENENQTFICSIICTARENTYHKSILYKNIKSSTQ